MSQVSMRKHNLLALVAFASSACAGHSEFMTKAAAGAPAVATAPDMATVVFIRDAGLAFAINFSVLDQSGEFLGDAVAESHFEVHVPLGQYFFLAKAENSDVVRAEVTANRTYFVHVRPEFGWAVARVSLDAMKPNEAEWRTIPSLLSHTDHLVPRHTARFGQQALNHGTNSWVELLWSKLSPTEQQARTLNADDGLAATP